MSRSVLRARRALRRALSIAAIAATGLLPASASAGSINATYLCDVSGDRVPVEFALEAASPVEWPAGRPTGTLNATLRGSWPAAMWQDSGATRLQYVDIPFTESEPAQLAAQINNPLYQGNSTSGTNVLAGLSTPTGTIGVGSSLPFTSTGKIASTTFRTAGEAGLRAGVISFNLALVRADGSRVIVTPSIRDKDRDRDRLTFEVFCDPAGPSDPIPGPDGAPTDANYPEQELRWVRVNVVDGPIAPRTLAVTSPTKTTAQVSLGASVSGSGVAITKYELFDGVTKIGELPGHAATVAAGAERTGELVDLSPGKTYTLTARAVDANGKISAASAPQVFTTERDVTPLPDTFTTTGDLSVPALLRSPSVKVQGTTRFEQAGGLISASLPLRADRMRLKVIGIVPVTADLQLIPSNVASGELVGTDLELAALYRLRVAQVYLFGSVPIAGAGTCQSKRVSEVTLRSQNFSLERGGRFTGTFNISDLSGCGAYNGVFTPLIASSGNTLSFTAAPFGEFPPRA